MDQEEQIIQYTKIALGIIALMLVVYLTFQFERLIELLRLISQL